MRNCSVDLISLKYEVDGKIEDNDDPSDFTILL